MRRLASLALVALGVSVLAVPTAAAGVLCGQRPACRALAGGVTSAAAHTLRVAMFASGTEIPRPTLVRVADALTIQANRDLRRYWPGPRVLVEAGGDTWGAAGWTGGVTGAAWQIDVQSRGFGCGSVIGDHADAPGTGPAADVCRAKGTDWTVTASHELLEMLEDPTGRIYDRGRLREICDPVENRSYLIGGVRLSDFVTPAWFTSGRRGPWDQMRRMRARDHGST